MHSRALLTLMGLLLAILAPQAFSASHPLDEVSQLIKNQQHQEAGLQLQQYLKGHPEDNEAKLLQGVLLSQLNRQDEAIKVFTELIRSQPSWPEPYNNLAVVYANKGEFERARQLLESALRTHASYAAVHDNLSGIYGAMASEAYGKALKTGQAQARPRPQLAMVTLFQSAKPSTTTTVAVQSLSTEKATLKTSLQVKEPRPIPSQTTAVALANNPPPPAMANPPAKAAAKMTVQNTAPEPQTPAVPEKKNSDTHAELEATLQGWAKAWSRQDVDQYLGYYASSFTPPSGLKRRDWEKQRRTRINAPKSIEVAVSGVKTEIDGNQARVTFKQSYRADRITKRTSKKLVLQKRNDQWLITQEVAL